MSFTGGASKLVSNDVSEIFGSHIDIGNPFDIPAAYALEINESYGEAEVNENLLDVNTESTDENEDLLTPRELLARETNEMIREAYYSRQTAEWEYEDGLVDHKQKMNSQPGSYLVGAVGKASKEATKLREKIIGKIDTEVIKAMAEELGE